MDIVGDARIGSSFRDPSGFVFVRNGAILRQVSTSYAPELEALESTGLYDELVRERLLTPHEEVPTSLAAEPGAWRVLRPEPIPFISYPYEWSFSQLRDAALLTLDIQQRALERGMTLKDASAYNVQFLVGRPILIDTLSFEQRREDAPWSAYRQFCQHFLAPLLLMSQVDIRLGRLAQLHLDGVPIDLVSRLLPRRSWLRWGTLLHIHFHAKSLARHADTRLNLAARRPRMSRTALLGLVDSLRSAITRLSWTPRGTEWADYTERTNYTDAARSAKAGLVREYLSALEGRTARIWDLGANTGVLSRIAAEFAEHVVAFDIDPAAVEKNYLQQRGAGGGSVLPLLLDLTNPSPAIGWANRERSAWTGRGDADVVMALALIHHLAIANNISLGRIAELFAALAPALITEFVPKTDSQAAKLLGSRPDIFPDYDQTGFESAFATHFTIVRSDALPDSERRLYLMERRP